VTGGSRKTTYQSSDVYYMITRKVSTPVKVAITEGKMSVSRMHGAGAGVGG
jgi:hypothetical protein